MRGDRVPAQLGRTFADSDGKPVRATVILSDAGMASALQRDPAIIGGQIRRCGQLSGHWRDAAGNTNVILARKCCGYRHASILRGARRRR